MQITLTQAEIEQAISNFVTEQVNIRDGHTLSIELKAGRGPEGYTATIDIIAPSTVTAAPEKPVATTRPAPVVDKPEPAAEPPAAAEEAQVDEPEPEQVEDTKEAAGSPTQSIFKNLQRPRNN